MHTATPRLPWVDLHTFLTSPINDYAHSTSADPRQRGHRMSQSVGCLSTSASDTPDNNFDKVQGLGLRGSVSTKQARAGEA